MPDGIHLLQVFLEHLRVGDAFARLVVEIHHTDTVSLVVRNLDGIQRRTYACDDRNELRR